MEAGSAAGESITSTARGRCSSGFDKSACRATTRPSQAGANWLLTHQQASGAWGESADSYAQPHLRGQGPPTASQTAWAVMGLVAAGLSDHPATPRGVRWLLEQQCADGTWQEVEFTGTGFPRVFYLRYHMYRVYFPLLAMARWSAGSGEPQGPLEDTKGVAPKVLLLRPRPSYLRDRAIRTHQHGGDDACGFPSRSRVR